MKQQFFPLFVATIFTTFIALVPSINAQDGQDPRDRNCEQNAETLTSTSGGNYRPRPWEEREIRIELRKSDQCQANWVKADVPRGTVLYLKDKDGRAYVGYTTQVNGVSFGDMMNYRTPFSACAKLPDGREVCTSIVGN
jgi:hypothetical protein